MRVFVDVGTAAKRQCGLTLIELMVAMVLGLLVAAGIVTVFASTSSSNKAQNQLARLQEEGRYAITRLSTDLRMANGQYCSNTGGVAKPGAGGTYLDHLRSPKVYASNLVVATGAVSGALSDVSTAWGSASGSGGTYPAKPTAAYSMPSFLFMRGYDCTLTSCTPVNPTLAGLPAMGTGVGSRVKGADVITVRYINPGSGWTIGGAGNSVIATSSSAGAINTIQLVQNVAANEPPVSNFSATDLALLADCSNAQIFAVGSVAGGLLSVPGGLNYAGSSPAAQQPESAPKVFDFNRDFQTVTYYLRVISVNNDGKAPLTGALIRRVNGGLKTNGITPARPGASEDELLRGIERLDFKYGVEDASGNTSFLAANQVDASTNCPPAELDVLTPTTGCLWRGIKSIEVSVLMDGQLPLYTLSGNDLYYSYSSDANAGLLAPSAHTIRPSDQGFSDPMLRREFNALVAIRNYNP